MKPVRGMVEILPVVASVRKSIMGQSVSSVTNVKEMMIAVPRGNALICMEAPYQSVNATAISDGLDQIAQKVSFNFHSTLFENLIPKFIQYSFYGILKGRLDLNQLVLLFYLLLESPIKSKDLDLSQYSTKQLSPGYRIHWRILKERNEIEIVAIVNGTSWVGLGWRPRKLNATCRNFPLIQKEIPSEQLVKALVSQNSKTPTSEPEPASEHAAAEPSAEKSPNVELENEPGDLNTSY